jgi:hypothetical protein
MSRREASSRTGRSFAPYAAPLIDANGRSSCSIVARPARVRLDHFAGRFVDVLRFVDRDDAVGVDHHAGLSVGGVDIGLAKHPSGFPPRHAPARPRG